MTIIEAVKTGFLVKIPGDVNWYDFSDGMCADAKAVLSDEWTVRAPDGECFMTFGTAMRHKAELEKVEAPKDSEVKHYDFANEMAKIREENLYMPVDYYNEFIRWYTKQVEKVLFSSLVFEEPDYSRTEYGPNPCQHEMKSYKGLSAEYRYCTKCGLKE